MGDIGEAIDRAIEHLTREQDRLYREWKAGNPHVHTALEGASRRLAALRARSTKEAGDGA